MRRIFTFIVILCSVYLSGDALLYAAQKNDTNPVTSDVKQTTKFTTNRPTYQNKPLPQKGSNIVQKKITTSKAKINAPKSPFEFDSDSFVPVNKIDEIVFRHLKMRSLVPARLCSDAVFLRRVHIDLCGTIPSADKMRAFLADKSADKRKKAVNELLNSEAFAHRMTMRLGDILRIKAEFPVNLWPNAAQAYTRFVFNSVANDVSYAEMVKQILTSEGSNFRVGEVNFFRATQAKNPDGIASCVALSFMGRRYDKMSESERRNIAMFFERLAYKSTKEWKEEIVFDDPTKRAPFVGAYPDGAPLSLSARDNPREVFAKWLTAKGNPYFSKAIVNRIWYWLFGQAIVSPCDDMFSDNRPANAELLDYLAEYFEKNNFGIKSLCRHIVLSRVYGQSFIPRCAPNDARKYFAVYPISRIDAEAFADIICAITQTAERYESTTPEPYTKFPLGESAVALPDGSVTTPFLELFGRPSRDTGLDSERSLLVSPSQKLHMINSRHIRVKIESGEPIKQMHKLPINEFLDTAYLSILSRFPTNEEKDTFFRILKKRPKNERGYIHRIDTIWALFNSEEFINRH